jgi:hypothetical protein
MLWPFHSLEILSSFLQADVHGILHVIADIVHGAIKREARTGGALARFFSEGLPCRSPIRNHASS